MASNTRGGRSRDLTRVIMKDSKEGEGLPDDMPDNIKQQIIGTRRAGGMGGMYVIEQEIQ